MIGGGGDGLGKLILPIFSDADFGNYWGIGKNWYKLAKMGKNAKKLSMAQMVERLLSIHLLSRLSRV